MMNSARLRRIAASDDATAAGGYHALCSKGGSWSFVVWFLASVICGVGSRLGLSSRSCEAFRISWCRWRGS